MGSIEQNWHNSLNRRKALAGLAGFLAGIPGAFGQQDTFRDYQRIPKLEELRTVFDFEAVAYEKLPRAAYNYTARGSEGEFTLRRNREAFDWVKLVPSVIGESTPISTATKVLDTSMDFPVMLAPSAGHLSLHPGMELATYQGSSQASNTPMIVSHVSSMPFPKIAEFSGGPLWVQLYPRQELEGNREPLESAQQAGCQAVVVTLDQQAAIYDRAIHDLNLSNRRNRPPRNPGNPEKYHFSASRLWYNWKLVEWLRGMLQVPMLIKGILTGEDALLSVENGVDGIIVSNHGGRTLDCVPSSLEVLPEIVEAVNGRIPVLIDSGFRHGSDVLKALALGASAVCLGRVPRWGLASYGPPGVTSILKIVQSELLASMAQCGVSSLDDIDSSVVRTDFP